MNKPLYKNLQNIDMNKTLHFGVNITDEDKLTVWKCPLKIYIVIEIYRRK